jgi:serine/threonine protein phosphatase PrpC
MTIYTPTCHLLSDSGSHTGYVRRHNEDAVLDLPEAGLWAVADGMGGHDRGDVASRAVVEALYALGSAVAGARLVAGVPAILQQVNADLVEQAHALGEEHIIGSTVVALVLEEDNYHCFWAGDSRIYLWRNGGLMRLTRDHAEPDDRLSGGVQAGALTRAVGAEERLELEYVRGSVYEDDLFLLCSDGLTKMVADEAIADVLAEQPPRDACEVLIDAALQAGGRDNVSCVIVTLVRSGW